MEGIPQPLLIFLGKKKGGENTSNKDIMMIWRRTNIFVVLYGSRRIETGCSPRPSALYICINGEYYQYFLQICFERIAHQARFSEIGALSYRDERMKTHTDAELFILLRSNGREKEAAFTELYARYSSRVYQYCRYIMEDNDAADDVFQDTFIRFLKSAERGTEVANIPAYLLRIARNLCLNAKRDNKLAGMDDVDDIQVAVEDNAVENAELGRLIEMALSLLKEEYREAFILQEYNGLSYKEIADVTNVPITTVRNRVVRAKKQLREILTPYLEEEKE